MLLSCVLSPQVDSSLSVSKLSVDMGCFCLVCCHQEVNSNLSVSKLSVEMGCCCLVCCHQEVDSNLSVSCLLTWVVVVLCVVTTGGQ